VEIQAGPFRRVVELSADPLAEEAKATYEDGILRVELPLRTSSPTSRSVPIETSE
jgi:HSP20 family protein